jgi:hypothetical protein
LWDNYIIGRLNEFIAHFIRDRKIDFLSGQPQSSKTNSRLKNTTMAGAPRKTADKNN